MAELWIENAEKISEDESPSCIEKYRLQLANCVEVQDGGSMITERGRGATKTYKEPKKGWFRIRPTRIGKLARTRSKVGLATRYYKLLQLWRIGCCCFSQW